MTTTPTPDTRISPVDMIQMVVAHQTPPKRRRKGTHAPKPSSGDLNTEVTNTATSPLSAQTTPPSTDTPKPPRHPQTGRNTPAVAHCETGTTPDAGASCAQLGAVSPPLDADSGSNRWAAMAAKYRAAQGDVLPATDTGQDGVGHAATMPPDEPPDMEDGAAGGSQAIRLMVWCKTACADYDDPRFIGIGEAAPATEVTPGLIELAAAGFMHKLTLYVVGHQTKGVFPKALLPRLFPDTHELLIPLCLAGGFLELLPNGNLYVVEWDKCALPDPKQEQAEARKRLRDRERQRRRRARQCETVGEAT